ARPAEPWSRRRPIRDGHRPGLVQSRADEYEFRPLREQRLSGPKRSRAHVEPVFVDEVVQDEGLGGSNASVEQEVVARLVRELDDPPDEILVTRNEQLFAVRPLQVLALLRDDL